MLDIEDNNVDHAPTHSAKDETKKLLNERRPRFLHPKSAGGFAGLRICLPNNLGAR